MNRLQRFLPSRRWLILPPILAGIAIVAGMVISRKELPRLELTERSIALSVIEVQPRTVRPMQIGYGTAEPQRIWAAIAEVKGRIVETHPSLDSGKFVEAGEVLVEIDRTDYELRMEQRRAELESAVARVSELKAAQEADQASLEIETELLDVARRELERNEDLYRRNAVPDRDVDNAKSNLLRQRQAVQKLENTLSLYPSQIASAKASVDLAQARLDETERDLKRTTIVSPFAGILADVDLETNQVVAQNERLFELYDNQVLEIDAQLSLAQLDKLIPDVGEVPTGNQAAISDREILEALDAVVITTSGQLVQRRNGEPIRISESLSEKTRTFGVVVQVENTANADSADTLQSTHTGWVKDESTIDQGSTPRIPLRPGTFCEIQFLGQSLRDVITVPRTALDGESVYVVDSENRLRRRAVVIGARLGEQIVIQRGLQPGDSVAIRPPLPAIDGLLVSPEKREAVDQPSTASETAALARESLAEPQR